MNQQCLHQLIEACMVAQAMGGDTDDGDDEVEELDRGDDRPDSTFFTLPAGWTAWSSSSGKQDSCRGLLAGTAEQEKGPAPHLSTAPSTVLLWLRSLLAGERLSREGRAR